MVRCKSITRLSKIKDIVILTQTDTTVGFLSQNPQKLYSIKSRPNNKEFIKVYSSFKTLLDYNHRIPTSQKNLVRRSKRTTFILKNKAFRVALSSLNSQILRNSLWSYSTSANQSKKSFDREFCEQKADIIIEDVNSLKESNSSKLIKINSIKRKVLR
jgi:tRNA A37 threonylcarbamoyladenosine synthetase subunit TsaC/SUA5/YrdC